MLKHYFLLKEVWTLEGDFLGSLLFVAGNAPELEEDLLQSLRTGPRAGSLLPARLKASPVVGGSSWGFSHNPFSFSAVLFRGTCLSSEYYREQQQKVAATMILESSLEFACRSSRGEDLEVSTCLSLGMHFSLLLE